MVHEMNEKQFDTYPLEKLLTPSNNSTVKMGLYWVVKDGNVFKHNLTNVWQCNMHKSIVKKMVDTYPGCELKYLPYAYVPKD